jgi:hypothetical protein
MSDMSSEATKRPTVYLHIGPPKTGTTFIQGTLTHWRKELKSAGVSLPAKWTSGHHLAAMDARGDHTAGFGPGSDVPRPGAKGAWPRLLSAIHQTSGTVVISSELFATADRQHARSTMQALADTDLHLVLTARDPARQLVSGYQQRIKQGQTHEFAKVAGRLMENGSLQQSQDLPALLRRWAESLAPDHVHIVTVPPPGSDPHLLWERFAGVVGIDSSRFGPAPRRSNESLGVAETEVLRRVNLALGTRLPHPRYGPVVRAMYAEQILASASDTPRLAIEEELRPVLEQVSDTWIKRLAEGGYDIRGDLEDLRPQFRSGTRLDSVTADQIADAAIRATADLLVSIAESKERPAATTGQELARKVAGSRRPIQYLRGIKARARRRP